MHSNSFTRLMHNTEQNTCEYCFGGRSKTIGRSYQIRTGQRIGITHIVLGAFVWTEIVQTKFKNQTIQPNLHNTVGAKLSFPSNNFETAKRALLR